MGIGIYHCDKCGESYTKHEYSKLKKGRKGPKCKCGGYPKEITSVISRAGKLIKGKYVLHQTEFQSGVERFYYWVLERMIKGGYEPEKIRDVYTASEASDFWGELERRKQFQADQAMKYLANIGAMVKTLFQMIRELRILDERLNHYYGRSKGNAEDDIALKGIWIDKVEGGAQKPTSIYGMATQLGFVTLPDYFFRVFPKKKSDIKGLMDSLRKEGANEKIIEVLSRKLAEFMSWLENTKIELETGRNFKLKYLRQHFHVIRMYLNWVKPYIKNVEAFNQIYEAGKPGTKNWTEIIRAAEGSIIDLELFGVKGKEYYKPCLRVVFHYATMPQMMFRKEYQRGPVHVGMSFIDFEAYALTDKDIKKYRHSQIDEDIEVIKSINSSIEAIDEDLRKYLDEAGDKYYIEDGKVKEENPKQKGFWGSLAKLRLSKKNKIPRKFDRERSKKAAGMKASGDIWGIYDNLKKYFGMIRW